MILNGSIIQNFRMERFRKKEFFHCKNSILDFFDPQLLSLPGNDVSRSKVIDVRSSPFICRALFSLSLSLSLSLFLCWSKERLLKANQNVVPVPYTRLLPMNPIYWASKTDQLLWPKFGWCVGRKIETLKKVIEFRANRLIISCFDGDAEKSSGRHI